MSQGNLVAIHLDKGIDTNHTMMRLVTDSGAAYIPLTAAPRPFRLRLNPDPVVNGSVVEVRYKAWLGPIGWAPQIRMRTGFDEWLHPGPDVHMTYDPSTEEWVGSVGIPVDGSLYPGSIVEWFDVAFHDGHNNWDNNNGLDWHFRTSNN
jgi:hypothetical protein